MKQHSALILEPETSSRGVQRAAFNVRICFTIFGILSQDTHPLWKWRQSVQVAKQLPSRICLGLDLNLAETLFFFRLCFTHP